MCLKLLLSVFFVVGLISRFVFSVFCSFLFVWVMVVFRNFCLVLGSVIMLSIGVKYLVFLRVVGLLVLLIFISR